MKKGEKGGREGELVCEFCNSAIFFNIFHSLSSKRSCRPTELHLTQVFSGVRSERNPQLLYEKPNYSTLLTSRFSRHFSLLFINKQKTSIQNWTPTTLVCEMNHLHGPLHSKPIYFVILRDPQRSTDATFSYSPSATQ